MENATSQFEFSDVHVHLQDKRFGTTYDDVARYLERAKARGVVRFVCSGTSPADWNRVAELGRRFDSVYSSFGVHPWYANKVGGDWAPILAELLVNYVSKDGVRAILGEVGLDYAVKDNSPEVKKIQEDALRGQLKFAAELCLPVVLHSVRANERILQIMREYSKVPAWLLHGWTATAKEVETAVDLGAFFSFSQRSVAPSSSRARSTLGFVPRDRVLLESDGPHLIPPKGYSGTPTHFPGIYIEQRSPDGYLLAEPASIVLAAHEIAALRKTPLDEFFAQLKLNEKRFFRAFPQKKEVDK